MEIIDNYTHCGLSKYRPIEDVEAVMKCAGVSRAVLAQHLGEYDNSYIEGIVRDDPDRFAGVCHLDATAPDAEDALARIADRGVLKGVRFTVDTLESAPALWDAATRLGMVIVLYAPEGMTGFVDAVRSFLDRHRDCAMVLTHLGYGAEDPGPGVDRTVLTLADYPGVYYQVSGMKMFCPYPHEPLYPILAEAAVRFDTSRCVWGSNYPVVGEEQDVLNDVRLLLDGKLPFSEDVVSAIVGGNARELWFG